MDAFIAPSTQGLHNEKIESDETGTGIPLAGPSMIAASDVHLHQVLGEAVSNNAHHLSSYATPVKTLKLTECLYSSAPNIRRRSTAVIATVLDPARSIPVPKQVDPV